MQKTFMIGNLTRDPELTETAGGIKICRFSIAVTRNYTGADGERKTDFFNCVAWRKLAETAARFLKKGSKVAVCGSIELRNYEDSQGIKRTGVDIVVNDVEFLTPKQGGNGDDYDDDYTPPPRQQSFLDKKSQLEPFDDDDDDIPF